MSGFLSSSITINWSNSYCYYSSSNCFDPEVVKSCQGSTKGMLELCGAVLAHSHLTDSYSSSVSRMNVYFFLCLDELA